MAEAADLAITDVERGIVLDILHRYLPGIPVWAFGSRVNGTHKPWSDLDLALISDAPVPMAQLAMVRDAFSDSDLPWKVDLVDWCVTTPEFRERIASGATVVVESPL